jgi:hypothetical protein
MKHSGEFLMSKNIALVIFAIAILTIISNAQNINLVGMWRTGGLSTTDDVNTVTGSRTASNGNTLKYEFRPDGRFAFVGYMQSTMYGCTTALFNDKQGKFSFDGSQLTLTPVKNFWRNTYSCSPSSNKERNYVLDTEVYDVRNKTDEYGKLYICLTNAKGETCYRREKQ